MQNDDTQDESPDSTDNDDYAGPAYEGFGIPPTSKVRLPETVQKMRKRHRRASR